MSYSRYCFVLQHGFSSPENVGTTMQGPPLQYTFHVEIVQILDLYLGVRSY